MKAPTDTIIYQNYHCFVMKATTEKLGQKNYVTFAIKR